MADLGWVDKLKVVELRKELRSRGVAGTGKKAELADRLKQLLLSAEVSLREILLILATPEAPPVYLEA